MSNERSSWASPAAWFLWSVAVQCVSLGVIFDAMVPPKGRPLLVGILAACSIPQIISSIIFYKRSEILAALSAGLFGIVITLGAAILTAFSIWGSPFGSQISGAFWITSFIIAVFLAVSLAREGWSLLIGIIIAALAFLFRGLFDLINFPDIIIIGGYAAIASVPFLIYGATAILFNACFKRVMLPIGRPMFK